MRRRRARSLRFVAIGVFCALVPVHALAQDAPFSIRGFADAGVRTFTATKSFEAILGQSFGPVFGGGIGIVERHGVFGELRASRFQRTGKRAFVFAGEVFSLDVDDTIAVTPLEVTGGYRFDRGWSFVPYGGAGAGWHRLEESSPSSASDEDVRDTFMGYHVLGGAEFRLSRWIAAAGEAQWTSVPDAFGQDPNSVARAFGESNLGGLSARVKIIIGR
jgi:opacity protein-like surface antigen